MAVRIRLKRMGRRHRPFFRICAMDARTPRDGRVIEELGYYDPMVKEVDARAVLKGDRIDYWLSVGAQPTPKVKVLIKKYGSQGTHLERQKEAFERLKIKPQAPPPVAVKAEAEEAPAAEAEVAPAETEESPAAEAAAADEGAQAPAAEEAGREETRSAEGEAAEEKTAEASE